jgi:hypothetical protein
MKWKMCILLAGLLAVAGVRSAGPVDSPSSTEPRVEVAKVLTNVGFYRSPGVGERFQRALKGDTLFSRDLHVALPGFKVEIEPASKKVGVLLWGNLPELSSSPVLESAVIFHDTKSYDLDVTLLRGRIVLTNTREKGSAKVWLRTEENAVELDLEKPGTQVALETYGRWPAGIPFYPNRKRGDDPTRSWEVFVLQGELTIKAARTTWSMTAPPGRAYFFGDSINGPHDGGPQPAKTVPDWADPKATPDKTAKLMAAVVDDYAGKLTGDDVRTVIEGYFKMAAKDTNPERAAMVRKVLVTSLTALDEVQFVLDLLNTSPYPEVRDSAVIGMRHWIGVRGGRDDLLYKMLMDKLGYSKVEAGAVMEMLHSPFDRDAVETYQTLIAFLKHRKQAIRELAHWHLIRLEPKGADIPYSASGTEEERAKAVAAWTKLKLSDAK